MTSRGLPVQTNFGNSTGANTSNLVQRQTATRFELEPAGSDALAMRLSFLIAHSRTGPHPHATEEGSTEERKDKMVSSKPEVLWLTSGRG